MRRKLFILAAAVSLMLSAAVGVMWERSHWRGDSVKFATANAAWHAQSRLGQVELARFGGQPARPTGFRWTVRDQTVDLGPRSREPSIRLSSLESRINLWVVDVVRGAGAPAGEPVARPLLFVSVRYSLVVAAAALPAFASALIVMRRSPRRRRQGLDAAIWLAAAAGSLLLYREVVRSPYFGFDVHLWASLFMLAAPALAFLAGWAVRRGAYPRRKVYYLIAYYTALLASFAAVAESAIVAALLCGPLVAIGLLVHSNEPGPPGLCRTCGYDLRATPDRCPECGADPHSMAR